MTNNTSNSYYEVKTWVYSKIKFMAWIYKQSPDYIAYLQTYWPKYWAGKNRNNKFLNLKYTYQNNRKIYDF